MTYFCSMNFCKIHQLGVESYVKVWELQKKLFAENILSKENKQPTQNHLIIVEHPHVYTFGKYGKQQNLLVSKDWLKQRGAEVYNIERGGDITYHGPGQVVVYPIFDLETMNLGLKAYIQMLERSIIELLAEYGIKSEILPGKIGVWIDVGGSNERKIAAIGVKSSRFITMHGWALNVSPDLSMFNHIVPCGIMDKGVSSISNELNEKIDISIVKSKLTEILKVNFALNFI